VLVVISLSKSFDMSLDSARVNEVVSASWDKTP